MSTTAEMSNGKTEERTILETLVKYPDSTLAEIANNAKLLAPFTYEVVGNLRMRDLLSVREDEHSTRRYSITDAGREVIGVPAPETIAAAEEEGREDDRLDRAHRSGLRSTEPLADFPHALKEDEQRELVLKAIDEKYRTLDGIKRRVGFPMWFDISELLAGMSIDYLIRKETKGDLTGYFRYQDKPLRFWRIGDGRIDFEPDPNFVPRDEAAKADELLSNRHNMLFPEKKATATIGGDEFDNDDFGVDEDDDLSPIGMPADAFETKAVAQNGSSNEAKKKATRRGPTSGPNAYKTLKAEDVEKAAAESRDIKETAGRLNISVSGLYKKFDDDPALRAAFENGFARRPASAAPGKKNGRPMKAENRPAKAPKRATPNRKVPDFDVEEVERLAREGKTAKEAAEYFGISLFVFKNRLNAKKGPMKPIRDAWYRGKKSGVSAPAKPKKSSATRDYKKRDRSTDTKLTDERAKVEQPTITPDKTQDKSNASEAHEGKANERFSPTQIISAVGYFQPELQSLLDDLSFNVGAAIVTLVNLEGSTAIDNAIKFLQREQARRERAAVSG